MPDGGGYDVETCSVSAEEKGDEGEDSDSIWGTPFQTWSYWVTNKDTTEYKFCTLGTVAMKNYGDGGCGAGYYLENYAPSWYYVGSGEAGENGARSEKPDGSVCSWSGGASGDGEGWCSGLGSCDHIDGGHGGGGDGGAAGMAGVRGEGLEEDLSFVSGLLVASPSSPGEDGCSGEGGGGGGGGGWPKVEFRGGGGGAGGKGGAAGLGGYGGANGGHSVGLVLLDSVDVVLDGFTMSQGAGGRGQDGGCATGGGDGGQGGEGEP
jgi:hypothetical protein